MFWPKFFRNRWRSLRVGEIILQDRKGRDRARLTTDTNDNPLLQFLDDKGETRMHLALGSDGTPRVDLRYANGRGSVQLEANDELNSAALVILGPTGKAQVLLGVSRHGYPAILMLDEDGNRVYPEVEADEEAIGAEPQSGDGDFDDDVTGFDWDDILRR